jgi:hypothetical protein
VKPGKPVSAGVEPIETESRYYVWFVELAPRPIYDEFAGADMHTYYNFLSIVDTCKMHRDPAFEKEVNHTRLGGDISDDNGHRNDDKDHSHEKFMVDLWIGKKPTVTALGSVDTSGSAWESNWAAGYGESQVSAQNATETTNNGPNNEAP